MLVRCIDEIFGIDMGGTIAVLKEPFDSGQPGIRFVDDHVGRPGIGVSRRLRGEQSRDYDQTSGYRFRHQKQPLLLIFDTIKVKFA